MSGPTAETIGRALAWRWRRRLAAVRRALADPDPSVPHVVLCHPLAVVELPPAAPAVEAFVACARELARHLWETAEPLEAGGYLYTLDGYGLVRAERSES